MKKSIEGYEGLYEVDDRGNVYSCLNTGSRRKRKLKPYAKNGYLAINLFKDKKDTHYYIHRLVAQAFTPNPNGYAEINHIDCDKHNNAVENLEWCDRMQNLQHSYDNGLKRFGEKHGCHKLTEEEVKEILRERNRTQRELSIEYKVSISTIQAVKCRRTWKHVKEEVVQK